LLELSDDFRKRIDADRNVPCDCGRERRRRPCGNNMRQPLKQAGLVYLDEPEED
jgi:hypothetical protein